MCTLSQNVFVVCWSFLWWSSVLCLVSSCVGAMCANEWNSGTLLLGMLVSVGPLTGRCGVVMNVCEWVKRAHIIFSCRVSFLQYSWVPLAIPHPCISCLDRLYSIVFSGWLSSGAIDEMNKWKGGALFSQKKSGICLVIVLTAVFMVGAHKLFSRCCVRTPLVIRTLWSTNAFCALGCKDYYEEEELWTPNS